MSLQKATSSIFGSTSDQIAGPRQKYAICLCIAALLSACGESTQQAAPENTDEAALNTAELPVGISLPAGFSATVFADNLGAVRHLERDRGRKRQRAEAPAAGSRRHVKGFFRRAVLQASVPFPRALRAG